MTATKKEQKMYQALEAVNSKKASLEKEHKSLRSSMNKATKEERERLAKEDLSIQAQQQKITAVEAGDESRLHPGQTLENQKRVLESFKEAAAIRKQNIANKEKEFKPRLDSLKKVHEALASVLKEFEKQLDGFDPAANGPARLEGMRAVVGEKEAVLLAPRPRNTFTKFWNKEGTDSMDKINAFLNAVEVLINTTKAPVKTGFELPSITG